MAQENNKNRNNAPSPRPRFNIFWFYGLIAAMILGWWMFDQPNEKCGIFQKNRKKFEKPIDKGVLLCYNMQANKEKFRFHRAAR